MADSKGFAFITGSAQGIGKAIALRLAKDGFDIAINDIPSKNAQLKDVEKEIQVLGRKTGIFAGDVSNEESVKGMIEGAVKHFGSNLDVFVANAGIVTGKTIIDTPVEEWDKAMTINGRGTFLCYKYAAVQMISQGGGGRIIGASSVSGKRGRPRGIAYCGTKFAIRGMTQVAALDLAKYGITVNAYAPGPTETSMITELLADDTDGSKHAEYLKNIPLGRAGQPNDVANLVSYLASKDSGYITGQTISINGGIYFD
ncbi:hypothetical protein GYMLUDRAFT_232112 [Collybiopsis luxurians FD-317 M1]|uniref:Uncharacterized protein n=1 Tax=Collybiopsis luxurians FD-317 M1 TaxID=944289 RepID=A0A0D0AV48_9AGAR|nr:hypothetical protein GYMLUDRAFT_232112 [Collybiopsis luxurians FD-317 M1]